ncbi:hypothetical protein JCM15519_05540 [Fundidesulfovibrio butyratiphilus]
MIKRVFPALLACVLLAATGCDTMKSTWKSTRKLYKEYVNVDPTIDLKSEVDEDPTVLKLATLFAPVDEKIEFMLRGLSGQESPPSREWCEAFMTANPWLTGLAVLSPSGAESIKLPSFTLKRVDYSPMMDFEAIYKQRKMAGYVEAGDLGSEVLVGQPLYSNNEFAGVLVVNFDPAALAKFAPDPDNLIIVSSTGAALWGGKDPATAQALAKRDWKKILAGNVSGDMREGGRTYLWQTRYLAHIQLVYIVAQVPPKPKKLFSSPKPAPEAAPAAEAAPAPAPQSAPASAQ